MLKRHTVRQLMAGNLCRCTSYEGIVDGVGLACQALQERDETLWSG